MFPCGGAGQEKAIVHKSTGIDPEELPLVVLIGRNSASASGDSFGRHSGSRARPGDWRNKLLGKGLVQRVFLLPFGNGLTLTTAKYYTPYGRLIQRNYSGGSIYDYYARHDASSDLVRPATGAATTAPGTSPQQNTGHPVGPVAAAAAVAPAPPPQPTGPAVKTAAGRVFYGGGGITPDIEVKAIDYATPARIRIYESAFLFIRELTAGQIPGLESYRVISAQPSVTPQATDYPVTDRVIEAFRNYVKRDPELKLTQAQIDADLGIVKLRLREEIATAAFGSEASIRVLLESDPQLLRAIEALPDAKRLAEQVRMGISLG
ncbi:MAG: S41 family peptidase [Pyrinomonadaceae bacterium]